MNHIIVPTCGGNRLLEPFCESFVKHTPSCRVYLVCNTDDESNAREAMSWAAFLAENGYECLFLRYHERVGFVRACNAAWRVMVAEDDDLVVVINDDVVFEGPWIEPLAFAVSAKPTSLAGPSLKYVGPDGYGYNESKGRYRYVEGWCVAACCGTVRKAWNSFPHRIPLGPERKWLFDPEFIPQFCEDVDLSILVVKNGGTLLEVPVSIHHKHSQTVDKERPYWKKNREYLQKKWALAEKTCTNK